MPVQTGKKREDKIKKIEKIEKRKTTALLGSFKEESAVLRRQKNRLGDLSKIINLHFAEIEKNIKTLNSALKIKTRSGHTLADVKTGVEKLQKELNIIEQTRKKLVAGEKRILSQFHTLTDKKEIKKAQPGGNKLKDIETTLEFLLDEADYLLRQGQEIKNSPLQIVQEVAAKEKQAISQLTKKLIELKKERKSASDKKKLMKDDRYELEQKIKSLQKKQIIIKKKFD